VTEFQDVPADPVDYLPHPIQPYCIGCDKVPEEIEEYVVAAEEDDMTPTEWVLAEEGTLNPATHRFACTRCYIQMGEPSGRDGHGGPGRWVAP
jgi:hypothetical protein